MDRLRISSHENPPFIVQIFGGPRIWLGGYEVGIGSSRKRALLALLVAAAGDTVRTERLLETLWGQEPPASATNQLHRLIGQTRRLFEPDLSTRSNGAHILPTGAGYRFVQGGGRVDLIDFRRLVIDARHALPERNESACIQLLTEAFEIASLPAFSGIGSEQYASAGFAAIETERCAAAVFAAGVALLKSGDELVPLIERVASTNRLNESLQAHLMTLLAAKGRRAEALQLFVTVKAKVSEELGVDPSVELRVAHTAVLTEEDGGKGGAGFGREIGHSQLPPRLKDFMDRETVREHFRSLADPATRDSIAAITGMAGVGKTVLATQWARDLADRYPDGQVYLNLRGFEQTGDPLSPHDALGSLLSTLGVTSINAEAEVSARVAQYRTLLSTRRVVLVLDNARNSEQVQSLLGPETCLTIVTSRNSLAGLIVRHDALAIPLERWTAEECGQFLRSRLRLRDAEDDVEAVSIIIDACAGLPLALAITAARSALRPKLLLPEIAADLKLPRTRLDALEVGGADESLRLTFEWSHNTLTPDAALLFRSMAAHPGSEIPLESVASISGLPLPLARRMMAEIVTASMATEVATGRYVMHDLVKEYAFELLTAAGDSDRAQRRVVAHYSKATRAAYLIYGRPPILPLSIDDAEDLTESPFETLQQTLDWYVRERSALIAVLALAEELALYQHIVNIVLDWRPMNQTVDSAADTLPYSRLALESAKALKSELAIAETSRDLGAKWARCENPTEAAAHYDRATEIYHRRGDHSGEANVLRSYGTMLMISRQPEQARRVGRQGYEAALLSKDASTIALCALEYATAAFETRRMEEALKAYKIALANCRLAHLDYLEPNVLGGIAEVHTTLGNWDAGLSFARSSLLQLGDYDDVSIESAALACIAVCAFEKKDFRQSQQACEEYERTFALVEAIMDKGALRAYSPVDDRAREVHRRLVERNAIVDGETVNGPRGGGS